MAQNIGEDGSLEVGERSWKKLSKTANEAGYREGITDGREKVFQKSFDAGYAEGFRNSYKIGRYKAIHRENVREDDLQRSTRGMCVICKNEKLLNSAIPDIVIKQNQHVESVLSRLQSD